LVFTCRWKPTRSGNSQHKETVIRSPSTIFGTLITNQGKPPGQDNDIEADCEEELGAKPSFGSLMTNPRSRGLGIDRCR
jgi:hypothetical protein